MKYVNRAAEFLEQLAAENKADAERCSGSLPILASYARGASAAYALAAKHVRDKSELLLDGEEVVGDGNHT
jgi:hypothetical protein